MTAGDFSAMWFCVFSASSLWWPDKCWADNLWVIWEWTSHQIWGRGAMPLVWSDLNRVRKRVSSSRCRAMPACKSFECILVIGRNTSSRCCCYQPSMQAAPLHSSIQVVVWEIKLCALILKFCHHLEHTWYVYLPLHFSSSRAFLLLPLQMFRAGITHS